MHGFLIIDKPKEITSFDVVYKVRKIAGGRGVKVGHTGTLDPLATGVLVLAFGQATKFIEYLVGSDKDYECKAVFGAVSNTYDADGEIVQQNLPEGFLLNIDDVKKVINAKFLGEIRQIPPSYSAKWIDGKRAHQLARKGKAVNLKASKINVYKFEIDGFGYPEADFKIQVSSGTYIRSLIHDLGQSLQCGAYVKELRRNKVGNFTIQKAFKIDDLNSDLIAEKIISIDEVMKNIFPRFDVSYEQIESLRHGKTVCVQQTLSYDMYSIFYNSKFKGVASNVDDDQIKFKKQYVNSEINELSHQPASWQSQEHC